MEDRYFEAVKKVEEAKDRIEVLADYIYKSEENLQNLVEELRKNGRLLRECSEGRKIKPFFFGFLIGLLFGIILVSLLLRP